jgi:hypothetical protein
MPESADRLGGNAFDAALSALDGLGDLKPHEISPNEFTLSVAFDLIFGLQSTIHQMKRELEDLRNANR